MTVVYLIVGFVGYSTMGSGNLSLSEIKTHYYSTGAEYLSDYVSDEYPKRTTTSLVLRPLQQEILTFSQANAMLIVHVLSGYTINGNVMNHALHDLLPLHLKRKWHPRASWAAVTCLTLMTSFTLSNLIPNLSSLLSVLGATCGYSLTFLFPACFALKLLGPSLTRTERATHIVILLLAGLAIGIGSFATLKSLAKKISNSPPPFQC